MFDKSTQPWTTAIPPTVPCVLRQRVRHAVPQQLLQQPLSMAHLMSSVSDFKKSLLKKPAPAGFFAF
jgi:hypothetical protein